MSSYSPISSAPLSDLGTQVVNETVIVSGFGTTLFQGEEGYTSQNYIPVTNVSGVGETGIEVIVAEALVLADPVPNAVGHTGPFGIAEGHGVTPTGVTGYALLDEEDAQADADVEVVGNTINWAVGDVTIYARADVLIVPDDLVAYGLTKLPIVWGDLDEVESPDIWTEITG